MGAARLPFFNPSTPYKKIVSKGIKREEEKKLRSRSRSKTRPGVSGAGHARNLFYCPKAFKLPCPPHCGIAAGLITMRRYKTV